MIIKGQGPGLVNVLWAERKTTSFKLWVRVTRPAADAWRLALSTGEYNASGICLCDEGNGCDGSFFAPVKCPRDDSDACTLGFSGTP